MAKRLETLKSIKACFLIALFVGFLCYDALAIHDTGYRLKTECRFSQVEKAGLVLRELGNESSNFNISSNSPFHKSVGFNAAEYWLPLKIIFHPFDIAPTQRSAIYVFISTKAP